MTWGRDASAGAQLCGVLPGGCSLSAGCVLLGSVGCCRRRWTGLRQLHLLPPAAVDRAMLIGGSRSSSDGLMGADRAWKQRPATSRRLVSLDVLPLLPLDVLLRATMRATMMTMMTVMTVMTVMTMMTMTILMTMMTITIFSMMMTMMSNGRRRASHAQLEHPQVMLSLLAPTKAQCLAAPTARHRTMMTRGPPTGKASD